jgi:cadmium resistance protein CadD (predicted permease)
MNLSPERSQRAKLILSPNPSFTPMSQDSEAMDGDIWSLGNFASELLVNLFETAQTSGNHLISNLAQLLKLLPLLLQMKELLEEFHEFDHKKQKKELFQILRHLLVAKVCANSFACSIVYPLELLGGI